MKHAGLKTCRNPMEDTWHTHPPPLEYDHEFFGLASVLKKIHKCDNATSPCCADLHFVENSPSLKVSRATNRSPLINACSKFLKYQPLWYWLIFWYWYFGICSYSLGVWGIPSLLPRKSFKSFDRQLDHWQKAGTRRGAARSLSSVGFKP